LARSKAKRAQKTKLPKRIPVHIAIIMDGNGRWARARGLPRLAGHRAGTENLRRIIEACVEFGVKFLTIYAFSTENWERPKDEVQGLMNIFDDVFDRELVELHRQGAQLRHIGRMEGIWESMQKKIRKGVELTKENNRLILNVAFNYGGRDEILYVIQEMIKDGVRPEEVTADLVSEYLFTCDCPDPDLVIRTSGEKRISNFLLWQAAYAEWIFPEVYWPDFGREELLEAIREYSQRERRFGRVPSTQ
jgi:undecaprenyl diphosphate synthase